MTIFIPKYGTASVCTCTTVRCCKPFQSIQICVDKLHRILHPMNDEEVTYMYTYKCVIQDVVCQVCRTY